MKELVFKKRSELEEICRKTHLVLESDSAMEYAIGALESGKSLLNVEIRSIKSKKCIFSCLECSCISNPCRRSGGSWLHP